MRATKGLSGRYHLTITRVVLSSRRVVELIAVTHRWKRRIVEAMGENREVGARPKADC